MDLGALTNDHVNIIKDEFDHPELWDAFQEIADSDEKDFFQVYSDYIAQVLTYPQLPKITKLLTVLHAVCLIHTPHTARSFEILNSLSIKFSQCPLVAGALFYIQRVMQPTNPKYDLTNKVCSVPFDRMDVLENSTHLCCASWLQASAGNLKTQHWNDVWNSPTAQKIRASMFDGTYKYCNKTLCPRIQSNQIPTAEVMKAKSPEWHDIIENKKTILERGPETLNLAYDRTCNLSCPSCRTEKIAAGTEERNIYAQMQEKNIYPLLKMVKTVSLTGSGDPFASKTFRHMMKTINKIDYPNLQVDLMTNGMLLTRKEWDKFSHLSGSISRVRVSIDGASKKTHELLRRGSDWETMLVNMKFIGELYAEKKIAEYHLTFVVQVDNFREMGQAVDLAKEMGAGRVYFSKISNWGTYSDEDFKKITPYHESHELYQEFLECVRDPRLKDPMVIIPDLLDYMTIEASPA